LFAARGERTTVLQRTLDNQAVLRIVGEAAYSGNAGGAGTTRCLQRALLSVLVSPPRKKKIW